MPFIRIVIYPSELYNLSLQKKICVQSIRKTVKDYIVINFQIRKTDSLRALNCMLIRLIKNNFNFSKIGGCLTLCTTNLWVFQTERS